MKQVMVIDSSVPPRLLRALGFRKMKTAHGNFKKGCYFNEALRNGRYFDPDMHSDQQFARNLISGIVDRALQNAHLYSAYRSEDEIRTGRRP